MANILYETGSFSSTQQSLEFVRDVAHKVIESIVRFSRNLESAFMIEVTSSDMSLLIATPDTEFDDEKMINEFESDDTPAPARWDKVAGVTEAGVGKSVSGGTGGGRRVEVLLKTKVVLEKDVMGVPSESRQVESKVESELDSILSPPVSEALLSVDTWHGDLAGTHCAYPIP